jgi:hypothetical protein
VAAGEEVREARLRAPEGEDEERVLGGGSDQRPVLADRLVTRVVPVEGFIVSDNVLDASLVLGTVRKKVMGEVREGKGRRPRPLHRRRGRRAPPP